MYVVTLDYYLNVTCYIVLFLAFIVSCFLKYNIYYLVCFAHLTFFKNIFRFYNLFNGISIRNFGMFLMYIVTLKYNVNITSFFL